MTQMTCIRCESTLIKHASQETEHFSTRIAYCPICDTRQLHVEHKPDYQKVSYSTVGDEIRPPFVTLQDFTTSL